MRLIDADALIHELNNSHYPGAPYIDAGISIAIGKVLDAPTIEPERKTGKWTISETAYDDTEAKCSECGFVTLVNEPGNGLHMLSDLRFCPNCGSKMEETE